MRCSPRWRTSRTWTSPSSLPHCEQLIGPWSIDGGLGHRAGLPMSPLDRPGNHVLEPAEGRPALAGGLVEPKAVAGVDGLPAPGAASVTAHYGPPHGADQDSRAGGRPDRPGAARAGAAGAGPGRPRARDRAGPLRPLAGEPAQDAERGLPGGRAGDAGDRPGVEGGDDHAGGRRRRRQPEPDPPRGDRRQGDPPHRPQNPRGDPDRRCPPSDRGLPDGGRRRVRRRAVARSGRRRRARAPHRDDPALALRWPSPSTRFGPRAGSAGASTEGRSGP